MFICGFVFSTRQDNFNSAGQLAERTSRAYAGSMAKPDCPLCGGTGWKTVERVSEEEKRARGARESVIAPSRAAASGQAESGPKRVWAVPCDCTGEDRAARVLSRARLPTRYEHCDFENFETDTYYEGKNFAAWNRSLEQAKLVTEAFARDYPMGRGAGLLIMGTCGVGKTHLAVAALRQIVLRGHGGLFYDYRELLREIQDSYNRESQTSELSILDPVLTADVLLLDDLGSSKPSPWALETVGHILNSRYNEHRITLLTTNFLDDPATNVSNDSAGTPSKVDQADARVARRSFRLPSGQPIAAHQEDTLTERLGTRIRSRLYEMCRTVDIVAPDYRRAVRQAGRVRS